MLFMLGSLSKDDVDDWDGALHLKMQLHVVVIIFAIIPSRSARKVCTSHDSTELNWS